jgi:hypothetical protein
MRAVPPALKATVGAVTGYHNLLRMWADGLRGTTKLMAAYVNQE